MIGVVTYVAMTQKDAVHVFQYGIGFFLAWSAIAMTLTADVFNRLSARKLLAAETDPEVL